MIESRASRWLAWTGPLFTVGFGVIVFGLGGSTPGEKASPEKVMAYYNSHQGRTLTSVFMGPLGALLLVLFASHLRSLARERNAGAGPTVLVAGAVLWGAGLLLGSVFELAAASASDHGQAQIAQTASVLNNDAWIPFIGGIAVMLVGAGMTVLGSGILPSWLGWVAVVGGIVSLLGPGGFVGFFLAPLWLLVAGVILGTRSSAATPARTA